MDFSLTAEQQTIRDAVAKICARFGDDHWLARDRDGGFPDDFHRAFAEAGWLGIAMPQEHGGAGLGVPLAAEVVGRDQELGVEDGALQGLQPRLFRGEPVLVHRRRGCDLGGDFGFRVGAVSDR